MTQQKRQFLNFLVVQVRLPLLQGSALAASSAAFKTYSIVGSRLLLRKPCSARLSAPAQSKKLAHKLTPRFNQCLRPWREACQLLGIARRKHGKVCACKAFARY
jgi:hypothetical protein